MARKHDSLRRDTRLGALHDPTQLPAPGMTFTCLEYDRGESLAIINYIRRDVPLPAGPGVAASYAAMGRLYREDGPAIPFMTAVYDPSTWAFEVKGHDHVSWDFLGTGGWATMTETEFVAMLYRLRGRSVPPLDVYGVLLSTQEWSDAEPALPAEAWPGEAMSVRRRGYEPEGAGVKFRHRNPCADIDLAVIGHESRTVQLLVDFKAEDAHINPEHKTHQAMSSIQGPDGYTVPSVIAQYRVDAGVAWRFQVTALNQAAVVMLAAHAGLPDPRGWWGFSGAEWLDLVEALEGC